MVTGNGRGLDDYVHVSIIIFSSGIACVIQRIYECLVWSIANSFRYHGDLALSKWLYSTLHVQVIGKSFDV